MATVNFICLLHDIERAVFRRVVAHPGHRVTQGLRGAQRGGQGRRGGGLAIAKKTRAGSKSKSGPKPS